MRLIVCLNYFLIFNLEIIKTMTPIETENVITVMGFSLVEISRTVIEIEPISNRS